MKLRRAIVLLSVALVGTGHAQADTIRVDINATGPTEDGLTWCTAFKNLRQALDNNTEPGTIVWVANGTYTPATCPSPPHPNACTWESPERVNTFVLRSGVQILGGFAGCDAPNPQDPDERDIDLYLTKLSGDINGDVDPQETNPEEDPGRAENSFHVVTTNGTVSTAVLEGFMIAGGNADGTQSTDPWGGGMYVVSAMPTVRECRFSRNMATLGGGLFGCCTSYPILTNCTFFQNYATTYGGGMGTIGSAANIVDCRFLQNRSDGPGAGLGIKDATGPVTITGCDFFRNEAPDVGGGAWFETGGLLYHVLLRECNFTLNKGRNGGGVYINKTNATLTLCKFIGNEAFITGPGNGEGGGAWGWLANGINQTGNSVNFHNCLFAGNYAVNEGGAVYYFAEDIIGDPEDPLVSEVLDCTITQNSADQDGGGIRRAHEMDLIVTNSILWGNTVDGVADESAQIYLGHTERTVVTYSDWQGHDGGTGNINDDPEFRDPAGVNEDATDDFWLARLSPCVDAANSSELPVGIYFDLAESLRLLDDPCTVDTGFGIPTYLDMGGYELNRCVGVEGDCDPQNLVDCDGKGGIDACEIAEFPELDQDLNGVLDDCQPQVIHGAKEVSFAAHAFGGYIDPRRESTNGIDFDQGIEEVTIVFTEPVYGQAGQNQPLQVGDFVITSTGGTTPTITQLASSDSKTVVLTLSGFIPLQEWTTIEANVWSNESGMPIVESPKNGGNAGAVDEYDRVDIGFLPCDVNQNLECEPFDVLEYRQWINLEPPQDPPQKKGIDIDYVDINRSGESDPFDLLVLRQLIGGVVPATKPWAGEQLGARP